MFEGDFLALYVSTDLGFMASGFISLYIISVALRERDLHPPFRELAGYPTAFSCDDGRGTLFYCTFIIDTCGLELNRNIKTRGPTAVRLLHYKQDICLCNYTRECSTHRDLT